MSRRLLPSAEHLIDLAVWRAVRLLRAGARVEDAARALAVGTYAAELIEAEEREVLDV